MDALVVAVIIDRIRKLATHPDLSEVCITSVNRSMAMRPNQVAVVIHCKKAPVYVHMVGPNLRDGQEVGCTINGVKQQAPNPARKNQTPFIKWLAEHPQLVDAPVAMTREAWVLKYGQVPMCYRCDSSMRWIDLRAGGGFWGCSRFKETGCKGSLNIDEDELLPPRCPDCSKPMRERDGRMGRFWGCTGYADGCKRTVDGVPGDGLRTELDAWQPASRAPAPAPLFSGSAFRSPPVPAAAPLPLEPTPDVGPPATPSKQESKQSTSLDALRRRFLS